MTQHNEDRLTLLTDVLIEMPLSDAKVALAFALGQYGGIMVAMANIDNPDDIDTLLNLLDEVDQDEVRLALEMD